MNACMYLIDLIIYYIFLSRAMYLQGNVSTFGMHALFFLSCLKENNKKKRLLLLIAVSFFSNI